jgi:hypothetical protein
MPRKRKSAAERMDAAETERRIARWIDAMRDMANAAEQAAQAAEKHGDAYEREEPAFTPMRADFAWAKRVTKQIAQLADEIKKYQ